MTVSCIWPLVSTSCSCMVLDLALTSVYLQLSKSTLRFYVNLHLLVMYDTFSLARIRQFDFLANFFGIFINLRLVSGH